MRTSLRARTCSLLLSILFVSGAAQALSLERLGGGPPLTEEVLQSDAVVLVFWASWSPRCRDIVERVQTVERLVKPGTDVVTVNFQESREAVARFAESLHAPTYLDTNGDLAKRIGISDLPGVVVIAGGEVVYRGRLPRDVRSALGSLAAPGP